MKNKKMASTQLLIEAETLLQIKELQESYAKQSPLGIAPGWQDIARGLIRQSLEMNKAAL